jgi:uncharacterized protein YbcC (UPF0753/DUF2309 family)
MTIDTKASTQRPLRVRARADRAAAVIAPYYGLDAAIAVNPVLPSLRDGFAAAIDHAAPVLGARGTLSEDHFRRLLTEGRIGVDDLAAAIRRHDAGDDVEGVTSTDSAIVDAFVSVSVSEASNQADSGEAAHVRQPSVVDELLSRWCRAALAPEAAAWPVPVHVHCFYGAWRAIARHAP